MKNPLWQLSPMIYRKELNKSENWFLKRNEMDIRWFLIEETVSDIKDSPLNPNRIQRDQDYLWLEVLPPFGWWTGRSPCKKLSHGRLSQCLPRIMGKGRYLLGSASLTIISTTIWVIGKGVVPSIDCANFNIFSLARLLLWTNMELFEERVKASGMP